MQSGGNRIIEGQAAGGAVLEEAVQLMTMLGRAVWLRSAPTTKTTFTGAVQFGTVPVRATSMEMVTDEAPITEAAPEVAPKKVRGRAQAVQAQGKV